MKTDIEKRQRWMGVLARASRDRLEEALAQTGVTPKFEWLRKPEIGLVLAQGRAGGTGAIFNFGEVTMTRCALKLADGRSGFAFSMGRDERKAELAAVLDALLQGDDDVAAVALTAVAELEAAQTKSCKLASRKAAATKVDFFAMTRGAVPK